MVFVEIESAMLKTFAKHCPYVRRSQESVGNVTLVRAMQCPIMKRSLCTRAATPVDSAAAFSGRVNIDSTTYSGGANVGLGKCPVSNHVESTKYPPLGYHNAMVGGALKHHGRLDDDNELVGGFGYDAFFEAKLNAKKDDASYRVFTQINRLAVNFPYAEGAYGNQLLIMCSNDYLGMSRHPSVLKAMKNVLGTHGAGSGGTRNIGGHHKFHTQLEKSLGDLHGKESALVFTSCYVANDTALMTLGQLLPNCIYFSDASNHASMIQGIRNSRADKRIFRHNDMAHLEQLLREAHTFDSSVPKIIVFESVYSMSGTVAPLKQLVALAKKYNALTFLDEVHAVGLYGSRGAGIAQHIDESDKHSQESVMAQIDVISGTLGKAFGVMGGYIAGSHKIVDFVRSYGSGLIFTTSLPPCISAGAYTSIEYLKTSQQERNGQKKQVRLLRRGLARVGIRCFPSESHIVPIYIGDAALSRKISLELLNKHNIFVQAINYPTVPVGSERLRVTPTYAHTDDIIDYFLEALETVWKANNIPLVPYPEPAPSVYIV